MSTSTSSTQTSWSQRGLVRTAVSWSVFPFAVVSGLGAGFYALDAGVSPSAVSGLGTLICIVFIVALERILPYRPAWNRSRGDVVTDALYLPTYLGVNAVVEPFVRAGAVWAGGMLSESWGLGLWPSSWPLFAQFVVACIVVEAFDYWPHRLLHEVPWLWRFHAIHHNPERVYWLNATRSHPIETMFRGFVNVIPLALAGASEALLAMVALTNVLLGLFQHANVDFKLGPLSWIFSVGEMHRWHHSVKLEEANSNYGSNFLFWDVVFGTRYRDPASNGPEVVGIHDNWLPNSWWAQMIAPFRARRESPEYGGQRTDEPLH